MTAESATWSVLAPLPWVVGVVVIALIVAGWQLAVMRRRRPPRVRRMVALGVLIVALALLAMRPARWSAMDERIWLVTEGTTAEALQEMTGEVWVLEAAARSLALSPSSNAAAGASWGRVSIIPDVGWLARYRPGATLSIAGNGVDRWEWPVLDGFAIDDAASLDPRSPLAPGVDVIGWSRMAVVGAPWVVEGRFLRPNPQAEPEGGPEGDPEASPGANPEVARLRGPGGEVVEGTIGDDGTFVLHVVPRTAGRWRYQLSTTPAGPDETIDVQVTEPRMPAVLWLEPAPRFETRHVKSWLIDEGGALAVRTATSRDRFRFERYNVADLGVTERGLARLNGDLLSRFDVVVTDAAYVATLPAASRQVLRAAIEGGLGLLLLPGAADVAEPSASAQDLAWLRFEHETIDLATAAGDAADLATDDPRMPMRVAWPDGTVSPALAATPRELAQTSRDRPVLADPANRLLVTQRQISDGKVGASVVEDTYRWVLEGSAEHHRRFWSLVLGTLARPRSTQRIMAPSGPVRVDEPLTWTVDQPASATPPDAFLLDPEGREQVLAWRQDLLHPNRWRATTWPRRAGWHGLRVGEEVAWLDVQEAGAWSTLRQAERRQALAQHGLRRTALNGTAPEMERAGRPGIPRPVGRLPLFLIALAAAAALWLDERLAHPAPPRPAS